MNELNSGKKEELENQIKKAKDKIKEGGIVIYPTETAYGVGADALNSEAIEKVYSAKERPKTKGLTTIVNNLDQVEEFAEVTENERKIIKKYMPGPLTLITEKKPNVPDKLNEEFVFRISSSEIAHKLSEIGPITATSANISGNETSYRVQDIDKKLRERADYIIDIGKLEKSSTSTIAEVNNSNITIHREGPISKEDLKKALK